LSLLSLTGDNSQSISRTNKEYQDSGKYLYHYTNVDPKDWKGGPFLQPAKYLTNNPNYSPEQARNKLALPTLPKYRLTIYVRKGDYTKAPNSLPFNFVKPKYGRLGFGKEYYTTKPVPIIEYKDIRNPLQRR
jgi:hypothetical protein